MEILFLPLSSVLHWQFPFAAEAVQNVAAAADAPPVETGRYVIGSAKENGKRINKSYFSVWFIVLRPGCLSLFSLLLLSASAVFQDRSTSPELRP